MLYVFLFNRVQYSFCNNNIAIAHSEYFWKDFFSLDISEYGFVHNIKDVDCESVLLGGHIILLFVYRLVVILLIANVFFYTVYMITSLLQVLILKKKI